MAEWIAVDWGTTHLRAWVFGAGGAIIARKHSGDGMGQLQRDEFEGALLALVEGHLAPGQSTPIVCCGMVGARQGWIEAPYAAVPCAPPGADRAIWAPVQDERLAVLVLPGVRQGAPADVMRGEETQIAGFLALNPDFDGVVCLPGTHTKWAHISAGEIVSFRTFMTGELFSLLSAQSVLRHAIAADGWDDAAFTTALHDAMTRPQSFASALFSLRAESLLDGLDPAAARARLSGLLVGIEMAAARPYWLGQRVAIVGDDALSRIYQAALSGEGVLPELADAGDMTLAGLAAAYANLKSTVN